MKTRLFLYLLLSFLLLSPFFIIPSFAQDSEEEVHVYLLRGIGRESGHWGNAFMNRIYKHYPHANIHLLDLPGSGQYYQHKGFSSIEKTATFMHQEKERQAIPESGKHILLATSLAGIVAVEWHRQYPQDFDGLVLVGSSFKKVCPSNKRVKREAKDDFVKIFFTADPQKREKAFIEINSNFHADNDSLLEKWVAIQAEHPVKKNTLLKQTIAGAMYQTPEHVPPIPVLLIGSEGDRILDPECLCNVQKYLHADLVLHDSAGHGVPLDAPVWLADQLSSWADKSVLTDTEIEKEDVLATYHYTPKSGFRINMKWLDDSIDAVGSTIHHSIDQLKLNLDE